MNTNEVTIKASVAAKLKRAGVKIVSASNLSLQCERCSARWSPMLGPGGRMPRNYWRCPSGCNKD